MILPSNQEILDLLDCLDRSVADDIESDRLEIKPWEGPKDSLRIAVEYAVCFANAGGGVILFGVADRMRGRSAAIHGASRYDLDTWRRGLFSGLRPSLTIQVEELIVPEGTGKLLVVRVPKGDAGVVYGTADGMFKIRVGKNCMPLDPHAFTTTQVATGAIDWSAHAASSVTLGDLDAVEIARARNMLRRISPESGLLKLDDTGFLTGLGVWRDGLVAHTGLLLFGREDVLARLMPQHQVHYVRQISETKIVRNDSFRCGLLNILERIEQSFTGPSNPERELTVGLLKLRIPSFPIEVIREAVLNAVTHRDYSDPGEVLIRHSDHELVITSPGGFIAGITPQNILRHEPASRNRALAEAFEKLRLVERAGVGRHRIFLPLLSYGKRPPRYETDGKRVTLRIYDGSFDERMASLVAKWNKDGIEVGLDGLLVLFHLRSHAYIDSNQAAAVLQVSKDEARGILNKLAQPPHSMLESRGHTKGATFHLVRPLATDLLGKEAYSEGRGLSPIRYAEMIREYLKDYGSISPKQVRTLLHLGESQSARVEVSRFLRKWSGAEGFLVRKGKPPKVSYTLAGNRE